MIRVSARDTFGVMAIPRADTDLLIVIRAIQETITDTKIPQTQAENLWDVMCAKIKYYSKLACKTHNSLRVTRSAISCVVVINYMGVSHSVFRLYPNTRT